jgi:acyl-CoA thioester hydrolase
MVKNVNRVELRVIYADTDQMGVVYHANYLRYFETGRNELLRALGMAYRAIEAEYKVHLPVVEAQASYKEPARYDDLLTVETVVARIGKASVRFEYRVLRAEAVLVTGHTLHACVGAHGKIRPLPEAVTALLGPAAATAA